jgi:hypothetical protein
MASKKSNGNSRYPDARVKGIEEFFELVQEESDWNPDLISKETLKTLGMARGKETNALFALRFLGIINGNGEPTEEFHNLREDFSGTLNKLVMSSYGKLFNMVPKSRMNQLTLVNFFMQQGYSEETAEYQAKLFVELCHDAGIELPNVEDSFQRARFRKDK